MPIPTAVVVSFSPLHIECLSKLITECSISVTATYTKIADCLNDLAKIGPDMLVFDVHKQPGGPELITQLLSVHPALKILIFDDQEEVWALRYMKRGVYGYADKSTPVPELARAIVSVTEGNQYASERIKNRLVRAQCRGKSGDPYSDLSDRELEVFTLIGEGLATRQIAESLNLSVKTVESHRAHIKDKLNFGSGMELVKNAIEWRRKGNAG
jgi:DNA-binding NarL/FixJ family response regulator